MFHISVAGYPALDESPYAKRATDALGLDLLIHPMEAQDFRANLARATYHSDSPLTHPNSVAFLLISEFARQHGVEVLLSGEAADELFGGYVPRYRRQRQMLLLQRLLARLPAKVQRAIGLAGYAVEGVPITMFSEYQGLLPHALAFLDRFGREDLRQRSVAAYGFVADPVERAVLGAMLADLSNFLAPLLRRLDRMSMAASVECRVPFLDQRLVHYVLNTPLSYRLKGATDKWVLKKIAEGYLPHDLVHRKKVGFPLPVADYLAPLAREDVFRDGFCLTHLGMHPRGFMAAIANWRDNVHGFFNLLALEIWGRLLILEQTVDEVTEHLLEPATSGRRARDRRPVPCAGRACRRGALRGHGRSLRSVSRAAAAFDFPTGFLWGAATSSHQVEGDNRWNDWWQHEQSGRLPHRSGAACRHYELFEQDFDLARAWGHNAHRLSIEWSRIEPRESASATMRAGPLPQRDPGAAARGLEPVVTLHHFTSPAWFSAQRRLAAARRGPPVRPLRGARRPPAGAGGALLADRQRADCPDHAGLHQRRVAAVHALGAGARRSCACRNLARAHVAA